MMWNKKDKLLLRILYEFGKKEVEPFIQKTTTLFLRLPEEKQTELHLFGSYDSSTHTFIWSKDFKRIQYDMIHSHYLSFFGDQSTLQKLFQDCVSLSPVYQNVIPYLLKLLNKAFYVVRIPLDSVIHFAFIKSSLISLNDTIPYHTFVDSLLLYKHYSSLMTRRKKSKKSKKSKSKTHYVKR